MSHFTVTVIGSNAEEQLAKFQENNMGDCPKEYLEFFDVTDKYLEEYNNEYIERIRLPNGELVSPYDDCFKVESNDIFSDEYEVDDGLERISVPFKELYSSFENFIYDWAGYHKQDAETNRYGYWENPNAK